MKTMIFSFLLLLVFDLFSQDNKANNDQYFILDIGVNKEVVRVKESNKYYLLLVYDEIKRAKSPLIINKKNGKESELSFPGNKDISNLFLREEDELLLVEHSTGGFDSDVSPGHIYCVDLKTNNKLWETECIGNDFRFSPDGTKLLSSTFPESGLSPINIIDVRDGSVSSVEIENEYNAVWMDNNNILIAETQYDIPKDIDEKSIVEERLKYKSKVKELYEKMQNQDISLQQYKDSSYALMHQLSEKENQQWKQSSRITRGKGLDQKSKSNNSKRHVKSIKGKTLFSIFNIVSKTKSEKISLTKIIPGDWFLSAANSYSKIDRINDSTFAMFLRSNESSQKKNLVKFNNDFKLIENKEFSGPEHLYRQYKFLLNDEPYYFFSSKDSSVILSINENRISTIKDFSNTKEISFNKVIIYGDYLSIDRGWKKESKNTIKMRLKDEI